MAGQWTEAGQRQQRRERVERAAPLLAVALALMAGISLGRGLQVIWLWDVSPVWFWAASLGISAVIMLVWELRGRDRPARCWGVIAVFAFGGGWFILQTHHAPPGHITRYLPAGPSTLATVEGRIAGPVHLASAKRGPFGRFSYKPPTTLARLDLSSLYIDNRPTAVRGELLLKIGGADPLLQQGRHVTATGWLSRVAAASNPGEAGYRRYLARQGIHGRISLPSPDNRTIHDEPAVHTIAGTWTAFRHWLRQQARSSLALGLAEQSEARSLLATVLLGVRTSAGRDLRQQFRSVGLAHLLAISGAHLGILLGILWGACRLVGLGPRWVTVVLLLTVIVYLLIVPARVPIVRASIMAGFLIGGSGVGRQSNGLAMLTLAALVVLIWRPGDLFSPGFQLSFSAVAALILFVQPVSHWLWPPAMLDPDHLTLGQVLWRRAVDYFAVCIVALLVVSPIVAYHFHTVHPLAAVLSVLALPAFAAVLAVGYLKIVVGLFWPSASLILSGPAAWAGASLAGLVQQAATWPGADLTLLRQPTAIWAAAMVGCVIALLAGRFAGRRWALVATLLVLSGWTVAAQRPDALPGWLRGPRPAATLRMLAVGDGACFVLNSGGRTVMFDCGSRTYLDVGRKTIVPALRATGVGPVEAMILSHPDLDHFSGAVTVGRQWPVKRVLVPPPLLREAGDDPRGPAGHLLEQLRRAGLDPKPIARGWSMRLGDATLKALWPPRKYEPDETNDGSLVLAIEVAGRRVLLNGDIQETAIARLMTNGANLSAAVTDLPHHGSFVENSPAWLKAVDPAVALQSSGPVLKTNDEWRAVLAEQGVRRLISHDTGMVTVRIYDDGTIETETFRGSTR